MSRAIVISEGSGDVAALREIFTRLFALRVRQDAPRPFGPAAPLMSEDGARIVYLVNGKDKRRARDSARATLNEFAVSSTYDRLGLVFDPDGHEDHEWRHWCQHVLQGNVWDEAELIWTIHHADEEIPFVPVPWDAGPSFDELDPGLRNLERVALGIAQDAIPDDATLVDRLLGIVRDSGRKTTWKTAFRLLHAVRKPAVEVGIMAQLFGQDKDTQTSVARLLKSTLLWRRLHYLAGEPA
ncbi:hypothetical protein [Haliangium sp.]|uniref:hypothetical protein n=1 Tax=Haliangium sp. TaxID=2663208 RepID=UPI003D112669